MTNGENQKPGDAGNDAGGTPTPTPTLPKVELKDGATFVDGKKMVAESDLIAAKHGLEAAAEKAQTVHNEAVDAVRLELSVAQQQLADSNAKIKEAQEARGQGATTDEEVARIKQERQDALTKVESLTTEAGKALELKRTLLVIQYGVPADSLANKTMQELDSFEEAVKAVSSAKGGGIGPYAAGGGSGAAAPPTDYDRRKAALESAAVGTRNAAPEQK